MSTSNSDVVGSMKVLAASSGGGHWIELQRLLPALQGHHLEFLTVNPEYQSQVPDYVLHVVRDATRWGPLDLLRCFFEVMWVVMRVKPEVVITTGAAPGLFAIISGRLLGARTIWLDSLANVEELSASGRFAGRFAHLWLTQWPNLARKEGPFYAGKVL